MKHIEDYLHLYLGAPIFYPDTNESTEVCWTHLLDVWTVQKRKEEYRPGFVLVLRPLTDMRKTESKEWMKVKNKSWQKDNLPMEGMGEMMRWLVSKHFDLFGLIESGIAITKESIKATT